MNNIPPATETIRVILAEDHTIVREGLKSLLATRADIEVIAEVANGRDAVAQASALRPQVVVMDLNMPELNGVDATRAIRESLPETRVLILSMHSGEEYVRPVIRAGASGYLLKGSGLSDLVSAIRAVARDEAFFSPSIAKIMLQDSRQRPKTSGKARGSALTKREREVLKHVAEGKSSPEIAELLGLSVKTVEGHRSRIMGKLEVRNVAGLVRYAIRVGIVSAE
ncbi:MAG: response regulator transcription factor [Myxococcales bacterium]|nr:response regulator transcription factor [Myxococcales bacterium]MCB9750458.1 response regulator transcription factor [Myxococcales bacterium]